MIFMTNWIYDAEMKIEDLTAKIEELTATLARSNAGIKNLAFEAAKNQETIGQVTAIREKHLETMQQIPLEEHWWQHERCDCCSIGW